MLDHETSLLLIDRAQKGDEYAKTQLIENNMPLIKSIIKRFRGRMVEYDDLIQLGSLGLVKAINNFDPKFNVRFSTYAVPMIVGEIKRFIRDDGALKVSRALKMQSAKINSYIEEFKSQNDKEPSISDIAEVFGITPQDVVFALDSAKYPVSIFEKVDADGGLELGGKLTDTEDADEMLNKILLKDIIMSLNERDKKIIILRYFRDKTQSEIAKEFGISQVQISRIEAKILKLMKEKLE